MARIFYTLENNNNTLYILWLTDWQHEAPELENKTPKHEIAFEVNG